MQQYSGKHIFPVSFNRNNLNINNKYRLIVQVAQVN